MLSFDCSLLSYRPKIKQHCTSLLLLSSLLPSLLLSLSSPLALPSPSLSRYPRSISLIPHALPLPSPSQARRSRLHIRPTKPEETVIMNTEIILSFCLCLPCSAFCSLSYPIRLTYSICALTLLYNLSTSYQHFD
jgi:hypothetical protein